MKSVFAVSLVLAFVFSSEANAQYPIYLNRGQVQYGYSRGPVTYYFNGGRQPNYWSYQGRYGSVRHQQFFQGNRHVGSVYGNIYRW